MWWELLGLSRLRSLYKVVEDVGAEGGLVVAREVLDEETASAAGMAMVAAKRCGRLRQRVWTNGKKNDGGGGHEGPPAAAGRVTA